MKVIYNNVIPFKGFVAMNICGLLFARKEYKPLSDTTINHESIHTSQIRELLYLPFYIIYVGEYIYKLFKYCNPKKAYRNISFEKEAYEHQGDKDYLKSRKHYAQWRGV